MNQEFGLTLPLLFDIHCHLSEYSQDVDWNRVDAENKIIHVSTALNKDQIAFHLNKGIKYWFAGIHPWDANLSDNEIEKICTEIPYDKIIGIGEIGLDKYHQALQKQLALLESQMSKASQVQLPTLYHLVGYEYEFIKLHKKVELKNMKIMHGFSSSYEVYQELDKLGFYFSLSKRLLNKPKNIKLVKSILKSKRYFIESDAPNNTDLDEVKRVAECLETDYNIKSEELREVVNHNFRNLLKESCESTAKI